jgi:hypothetical protein
MTEKGKRIGLAMVLGAVIGMLGGCGDIYSREDFANLVKDKTSDEVAGKLGKPKATDESDPSRVVWTYQNVTFEAGAASKRDSNTAVVFKREPTGKLRVADVQYK